MIIRDVFYELQSRMQEPRKFIQVLAGPRQVGKTTIVEQFAAQAKVPVTSLTAEMAERTIIIGYLFNGNECAHKCKC